jgi:hypothetical protein
MPNSPQTCCGWIENLLGYVFFENPFTRSNCKPINDHFNNKSSPFLDGSKFDRNYLNIFALFPSYFRCIEISDIDPEEKCLLIYIFEKNENKYPDRIFAFYQDPSEDNKFIFMMEAKVTEFDEKGLILLKSQNINQMYTPIKSELLQQILININELYGQNYNTFVGKYGGFGWKWDRDPIDVILPDCVNPVFCYASKNYERHELVNKLVKLHMKRLFLHLKFNNMIISQFGIRRNAFEIAILFRRQTNGCIIFSRSFIQSYIESKGIEEYIQYRNALEHSTGIINSFSEEMTTIISVNLEDFMVKIYNSRNKDRDRPT